MTRYEINVALGTHPLTRESDYMVFVGHNLGLMALNIFQ